MRKLKRRQERGSRRWQLTGAHSVAHPWLPAASQQSGGHVSDTVAASLPGQHTHTQSCSRFCASFLFLPSPADQSQLQKKNNNNKKSLDVVQLQQTIRP